MEEVVMARLPLPKHAMLENVLPKETQNATLTPPGFPTIRNAVLQMNPADYEKETATMMMNASEI